LIHPQEQQNTKVFTHFAKNAQSYVQVIDFIEVFDARFCVNLFKT